MKTVREVSALSGVSVRALHHYHKIGLLVPTAVSPAGYRLYDDAALERLQTILIYRELEFSLADIRRVLDSPAYDRARALEQQIRLLEMKREHLQNVIDLARGIKLTGVKGLMDFKAFDTCKIDEYAEEARHSWGQTPAYHEFEEKTKNQTKEQMRETGERMMALFSEFGALIQLDPGEDAVQAQVQKLRDFITAHYYACTPEILSSLGDMYAGGGSMTQSIDAYGGEGTAKFAARAIEVYCSAIRKEEK